MEAIKFPNTYATHSVATYTRASACSYHQPDNSDPDLKNMIERIENNKAALHAIRIDNGMMFLLQLLHQRCTPLEIAQFIKSVDGFLGIGVKSLEECFPNRSTVDLIMQRAYGHFTSSLVYDNAHYLTGESARTLYNICNFGYTESEDKTHKKVLYLIRSAIKIKA